MFVVLQPMQSDGDRYSCLATNSLMGSQVGEQRSSVKELAYCSKLTVYTCGSRIITIPLARPAISNITGPVTFMSGQSSTAILSCTVSGLPIEDVMVNWTFNMETLRTSDKYSMAVAAISNHQLTINNINTDDTGTYRCTVFHRLLSNTETRTVQVTVLGESTYSLHLSPTLLFFRPRGCRSSCVELPTNGSCWCSCHSTIDCCCVPCRVVLLLQ